MNRRQILQAGVSALVSAAAVEGAAVDVSASSVQNRPGTTSRPLGTNPLGAAFSDWQGTMLEVTYPPGAESASHQHPGPTFGYVVRGKILWAINGEPARVLEAGQSFFEPLGSVHSTSANASPTEPATISVVILGRPGDALSKPAKPSGV